MAMTATEKLRQLHGDKMLTVEEMESVAGGTFHQTADDSRFLNVLLRGHPAQPDRHGERKMEYDVANNSSRYDEIRAAWKACGVTLRFIGADYKDNTYYIGGQQVTQAEARSHAMNVMGKQLEAFGLVLGQFSKQIPHKKGRKTSASCLFYDAIEKNKVRISYPKIFMTEMNLKKSYTRQGVQDLTENFPRTT